MNNVAEYLVYKPEIVGLFLIITGFMLFFSEHLSKKKRTHTKVINFNTSVLIGIAQGLAALPGFSRSGWTIAAGLLKGLDKMTAARYSFLLSIPIIIGASMVYPVIELDINEFSEYNWTAIIIGTLVSGIVGYFCIKYFLKFLEKFSMNIFAWYCIIIGIGAYIFFTIN